MKLKEYYQLEDSKDLLETFKKIINYDNTFQLSLEEEKIVGDTRNLVVKGRSGTGKTLSFELKLFSIELFFKTKKSE